MSQIRGSAAYSGGASCTSEAFWTRYKEDSHPSNVQQTALTVSSLNTHSTLFSSPHTSQCRLRDLAVVLVSDDGSPLDDERD